MFNYSSDGEDDDYSDSEGEGDESSYVSEDESENNGMIDNDYEGGYKSNSEPEGSSKETKCTACGKLFANEDSLLDHLLNDMKNAVLKCKMCGGMFSSVNALENHRFLLHDEQGQFNERPKRIEDEETNGSCYLNVFAHSKDAENENTVAECEKNFDKIERKGEDFIQKFQSTYKKRLRTSVHVSNQEDTPFTCPRCDRSFVDVTDLNEHVKNHTGDFVEKRFSCPKCGKLFLHKFNLNLHTASGTCGKLNQCKMSDHVFKGKDNLQVHVTTNVKKETSEVNHFVRKKFTGNEEAKNTITKIEMTSNESSFAVSHEDNSPFFKCPECRESFTNAELLKKHILNHGQVMDESSYQCGICNTLCINRKRYREHMMSHTGIRTYGCSKCGKRFTRRYDMKRHELTVHSDIKPYQCVVCKMKFVTSTNLKNHMIRHTGEKPYSCTYCRKSFTKSFDLKRHERVHAAQKPFPFEE